MKFISDEVDANIYDTDMMETDCRNGNFNPLENDLVDYSKRIIVLKSIINGQHKQAKEQAIEYGFDYADIKATLKNARSRGY